MCDFVVNSPEGQQWKLTFPEQVLLKLTVECFKEELVKLIATLYAYSEYTKHNIRLIIGDKPLYDDSAKLSDYVIKPGKAVQKLREVNGGTTSVQMVRMVNGG